jgi:hypothetical protein
MSSRIGPAGRSFSAGTSLAAATSTITPASDRLPNGTTTRRPTAFSEASSDA